jgi:hypothetical protein
MTQKTTWIHIGFGKTGTTSLQKAMFSKHSEILYLGKNWIDNPLAKDALASLVRDRPHKFDMNAVRNVFAAMLAESNNGKRIGLLSEEDMTTSRFLDPAIITARVKTIFPDAKILLVIREPVQWLQSMYFFRLSLRFPETLNGFADWVRTSLQGPVIGSDIGQLRVGAIAELYANAFGVGNVKVLLYEDLLADAEKFVTEVCTNFGVGIDEAMRLYCAESATKFEKSRISKRQEDFLKQYKLVREGRYAEYILAVSPLLETLARLPREKAKSLLPTDLFAKKTIVEQELLTFSTFLDRAARQQFQQHGERAAADIDDDLREDIRKIMEPELRYIATTFNAAAHRYLTAT